MDRLYILYIIACAAILPVFAYSIYVSVKVKSVFNKYSGYGNSSGITAEQAARRILDAEGLTSVQIWRCRGSLTDHYDPRSNIVFLSDSVYGSSSLSAIGVAAHECGHAIQTAKGYLPIKLRSAFYPIAAFGSRAAFPLLIFGLLLDMFASAALSDFGYFVILIGIVLYATSAIFALITLPCEYDASKRARLALSNGILYGTEVDESAEVLRAAAKTYVASFAITLLQLIRIIFIFGGRRRR